MSGTLWESRRQEGEDMDSFLARTEGTAVAPSLRRWAWVSGMSIQEVSDMWRRVAGNDVIRIEELS